MNAAERHAELRLIAEEWDELTSVQQVQALTRVRFTSLAEWLELREYVDVQIALQEMRGWAA